MLDVLTGTIAENRVVMGGKTLAGVVVCNVADGVHVKGVYGLLRGL